MKISFVCCFCLLNILHGRNAEGSASDWKKIAASELDAAVTGQVLNRNIAKNAILFIGDGMGISTQTAARIYRHREGGLLAMERLPHVALSKTYSVDLQVPGEADTATAILCGIKTKSRLVGMTESAKPGDCSSGKGKEVQSVLEDAYTAGKSTGIVTTRRIVDATVAAAYGHSVSDTWYSDATMSEEALESGCKDMAQQFYEASEKITVALGGGRKYMYPSTKNDEEYPELTHTRKDGKDLMQMWRNRSKKKGLSPSYVWRKADFDDVDISKTDTLIGLFEPDNMRLESERVAGGDGSGEPSLSEMTKTAIKMLKKNEKGYFLLVEGGRIDDSHHNNSAYNALKELIAFDEAVKTAVKATSAEDTLIIVTGDHSQVLSFGGKTSRNNNILGMSKIGKKAQVALDRKAMTTLMYSNGPGYQGYQDENGMPLVDVHTPRRNPADQGDILNGSDYKQQSTVPLAESTHAGEDVAIMAGGPMAHLFHGVHEQHFIAHVIRHALCIGGDTGHCTEGYKSPGLVSYLGNRLYVSEAEYILRVQFIVLIVLGGVLLVTLIACLRFYRKARQYEHKSEVNGNTLQFQRVPIDTIRPFTVANEAQITKVD